MIGKDIHKAKLLLERGEVVGLPTETVYGLAANGYDDEATLKIFEVKERPSFNPLILHTDSILKVQELVREFPPLAKQLVLKFWPGPLTLLLPKSDQVSDVVTSGSPLVAVRIPDHELTLELLSELNFPVAAPSANKFGRISPTSPKDVVNQLGEEVPYVLDGGQCDVGIESTIISFEEDIPVIYRVGGLSVEEIQSVIGQVKVNEKSHQRPKTSGMLKSHYAPQKPFYVGDIDLLLQEYSGRSVATLSFYKEYGVDKSYVLSKAQNLKEAAKNLFNFMSELDKLDVDVILAEYLPEIGLGRGVNDRLRRADSRNKVN